MRLVDRLMAIGRPDLAEATKAENEIPPELVDGEGYSSMDLVRAAGPGKGLNFASPYAKVGRDALVPHVRPFGEERWMQALLKVRGNLHGAAPTECAEGERLVLLALMARDPAAGHYLECFGRELILIENLLLTGRINHAAANMLLAAVRSDVDSFTNACNEGKDPKSAMTAMTHDTRKERILAL